MSLLMQRTVGNGGEGLKWFSNRKLADIKYADDAVLVSRTQQDLQCLQTSRHYSSIMTKKRVFSKRHSSGIRILPMILTLTGVTMVFIPEVLNARHILYKIGEEGTRGSEVMRKSLAAENKVFCAAVCSTVNGCEGFNWMPTQTLKCELLSSLQIVAVSTTSDLYVPGQVTSSLVLSHCPPCMGLMPSGGDFWEHRCEENAVVTGIASESSFPNFDYLLCGYLGGMEINLNVGYSFAFDMGSCNTLIVPDTVIDCVWSSSQYYDPPNTFKYSCRSILTRQKVDKKRCMNVTEKYGFTSGISTPVQMFLCPPHMVAQRMYGSSLVATYVICCLL
ncbi:uncharacterized protein [Palaemon carinicauda]|uniref:uncharacterized protein n=1 Tax=Palaemon carinicauda TaxID=392227 RepID=UPI0035B592FA